MTNSKHTKKALLSSVIALILCCSMLIGTTFAWFTESVTSGVTQSTAGNLDVELYHTNDAVTDEKVTTTTELFTDVELWEPGVVAYENLTVANVGNLALKYLLSVNFENENATTDGYKLSQILKVAVVEGGVTETDRDALVESITDWQSLDSFVEEGTLLTENSYAAYGIVIYWEPSENDNNWKVNNGKTTSDGKPLHIDLGINLIATQKDHESDSFGTDYDEDAVNKYTYEIDELKELLANAKSGETVTYTLSHDAYVDSTITVPYGVTLVLDGNGHKIISDTSETFNVINANIEMSNLAITGNANYAIFTKGATWENNGENAYVQATFTNVTVDLDNATNFPVVFNGKGTITMNKCTVIGAGLPATDYTANCHVFAGAEIELTVNGGNIGSIMLNANSNATAEMTVDSGAEIGKVILECGNSGDTLTVAPVTLTDGTIGETVYAVYNATQFEKAVKLGNTHVVLAKDITYDGSISYKSAGNITIDGNGKTLTIKGIYSKEGKSVTLSNMTLVDSNPDDYAVYNQGGEVNLTNVTYSGTTSKAIVLAGGGKAVLTDCSISGELTGTPDSYSTSNIWCGDGRTVTVNGGSYGSIFMNASEGAGVLSASTITVNDGTIGKLILETEKNNKTGDGNGYKSATLIQNGGTIGELVENPQNYDLSGLTKLN